MRYDTKVGQLYGRWRWLHVKLIGTIELNKEMEVNELLDFEDGPQVGFVELLMVAFRGW